MTTIAASIFFFFNDTATTEIYTLSLHDALPISLPVVVCSGRSDRESVFRALEAGAVDFITKPELRHAVRSEAFADEDRKSTRLNSSHANISYAVFCLKKKNSRLHQRIRVNQSIG